MSIFSSALLAFADGTVFHGKSFGHTGHSVGEIIFNTSMTGYQEILTDPSYFQQIVMLTYPHIGNTGINLEDIESSRIYASGLVVKDIPRLSSNYRQQLSLPEYLQQNQIVAIAGVDTRKITRLLQTKGSMNAAIMAFDEKHKVDTERVIELARNFKGLEGADLAQKVSTQKSYTWHERIWDKEQGYLVQQQANYHIVAYDYGIKLNILRILAEKGCKITVVPAKSSFEDLMALNPDGVFLSNGPGDPDATKAYTVPLIQQLIHHKLPTFGICLGHQLIALAAGAKTIKMKFGHHGANHPVKDLVTGKVMITSQNHGFAVDKASIPDMIKITHISLFDGSVQGLEHTQAPIFCFQGHPEASPGPHDLDYLFDRFISLIQANRH